MSNIKLTLYQRTKLDESDDSIFYSDPRYVHHLDKNFRDRLTKLYSTFIPESSIILDLMSSWVSHLPNKKYQKVIGHGLNEMELSKNKSLDQYWVQDLNQDFILPLDDNSVDFTLLVAGWQYLQYPELISSELNRITKEHGYLIISFSNRAFWNKSPNIWVESTEKQRIEYVTSILIDNKWNIDSIISENNNQNILMKFFGSQPDPFYSIIATKI
tara:strand:- start:2328 stop:2972 length:645 start_codon:yes stop_codon:yes gene_type:complete